MSGPDMQAKREVWLLWDSDQIVKDIHPGSWCSGQCVVHNPSDHRMRTMPLRFDVSRKAFVRICDHNTMHQDPDERVYWTNQKLKAQQFGRLYALACEKLNAWACPDCICGCCWIGSTL